MVVVPPQFVGRHSTYIALVASIVTRTRRERQQSQEEIGRLVGLSRHQVARRERNVISSTLGWGMSQLMLLDQAWMLPMGSLAQECLEAYEKLRHSLTFQHPVAAVRPLTVEQLIDLYEHAQEAPHVS